METRKKVLHFLPRNTFSGAENVVCQMIALFRGEIDMYYCCPEGPIRQALEERSIPYLPMAAFSVKEIRRLIRQEKPDVIQAHDMLASVVCAAACGRTPLVCHIHNNNFDSRGLTPKTALFYFAAKKAKHIFWVSSSAMDSFYFRRAVAGKSSVLRNIIDPQALRNQAAAAERREESHVVFLGRMSKPKDPLRMLRVLEQLAVLLPNLNALVIGGPDVAEPELEQRFRKSWEHSPAREHIHLLGFQSNPYGLLQNTRVLLMTSLWEGTPMSALEAMALGVPIVSTPVDGMCQLVEPGKTGFLEETDEALARRCAEIIRDAALRQSLSQNAIVQAEALLDAESYKQALREAYGTGGTQ